MTARVLPPESVFARRRRQVVLVSMIREYADQAGLPDVVADSEALAGRLLADMAQWAGVEKHDITAVPVVKMDTPTGLFGWACSCGSSSKGQVGSEQRALKAGAAHAAAKRRG